MVSLADHPVISSHLTENAKNIVNRNIHCCEADGLDLIDIAGSQILDHGTLVNAVSCGKASDASFDFAFLEPLPEAQPFYGNENLRIFPHVSWSLDRYDQDSRDPMLSNVMYCPDC